MAKGGQRSAICVDNTGYPASLEPRNIYRVLPDAEAEQDGDLRVIGESGEDYPYPGDYLVILDFPPVAVRALQRSFAREAQEAR